jgi:hypothetical protein
VRTRLLAASLIALLAAVCGGGQSEPAQLPRIVSAVAERNVVDGAAQPNSTLRVTFSRSLVLPESDVPFASHFELSVPTIDPVTGDERNERVFAQAAQVDSANSRVVVLRIARLIPEGSDLIVSGRAFVSRSEEELRATVESDLTPAQVLLATVVFQPTNPSLVTASESREISAEDRDPAAQRSLLEAHLAARGASPAVREAALASYDTMPGDIVPAPKARAALAALTGTFAEAAVASLLTADNCTGAPAAIVAFQEVPGTTSLLARVTYARDGRRVLSLDPRLETERIEHLMPMLAHEAIHCDRNGGRFEEVAATALDTFLYLHLVAVTPEITRTGSLLARELNTDAIAMINSGRRYPESVGVLRTPGVNRVLPGTNLMHASFADFVAASYAQIQNNTSPPEPVAEAYVANIAAAVGMPARTAFDLVYLDELLGFALDPRVIAAALDALELAPVR